MRAHWDLRQTRTTTRAAARSRNAVNCGLSLATHRKGCCPTSVNEISLLLRLSYPQRFRVHSFKRPTAPTKIANTHEQTTGRNDRKQRLCLLESEQKKENNTSGGQERGNKRSRVSHKTLTTQIDLPFPIHRKLAPTLAQNSVNPQSKSFNTVSGNVRLATGYPLLLLLLLPSRRTR